jgi:hypothetical protein|tara:strand:- start:366 stop:506 length:141 start_codon:yes stop_codon:yes gene_type:complete
MTVALWSEVIELGFIVTIVGSLRSDKESILNRKIRRKNNENTLCFI